jgi:hypothetical protein
MDATPVVGVSSTTPGEAWDVSPLTSTAAANERDVQLLLPGQHTAEGRHSSTAVQHVDVDGSPLDADPASTSSVPRERGGEAKSTIPAAVFNYVNSIIGAGSSAIGFRDYCPRVDVAMSPCSARMTSCCGFSHFLPGIIGLPFALQEAGFVVGVLLLLLIALMTSFSVQLIVRLGVQAGQLDYEQLCRHAFGAPGYFIVLTAMSLFAWGAMVGYLVIIGDNVSVRAQNVV